MLSDSIRKVVYLNLFALMPPFHLADSRLEELQATEVALRCELGLRPVSFMDLSETGGVLRRSRRLPTEGQAPLTLGESSSDCDETSGDGEAAGPSSRMGGRRDCVGSRPWRGPSGGSLVNERDDEEDESSEDELAAVLKGRKRKARPTKLPRVPLSFEETILRCGLSLGQGNTTG